MPFFTHGGTMNALAVRYLGRFTSYSIRLFSRGSDGTTTSSENLESKRARLLYQSTKRGILENDILLGGFYREHLGELTASQLETYDQLVNGGHNEWDIYYWMIGAKPTPDNLETDVMQMLRKYALSSRRHYYHKGEKQAM